MTTDLPRTERPDAPAYLTRYQSRGTAPGPDDPAGDADVPLYLRRFRERPDPAVLEEAGFEVLGEHRFPTDHVWTTESLTGLVFSTSILSRAALGDQAGDLEADLRRELHDYESAGALLETIGFAFELARRPAQVRFVQR